MGLVARAQRGWVPRPLPPGLCAVSLTLSRLPRLRRLLLLLPQSARVACCPAHPLPLGCLLPHHWVARGPMHPHPPLLCCFSHPSWDCATSPSPHWERGGGFRPSGWGHARTHTSLRLARQGGEWRSPQKRWMCGVSRTYLGGRPSACDLRKKKRCKTCGNAQRRYWQYGSQKSWRRKPFA